MAKASDVKAKDSDVKAKTKTFTLITGVNC